MLRLIPTVVAALSALSGLVLAVLPALVVGFVTLFYNSAGGVLIFLGNLIGLVPDRLGTRPGGSSLPLFQQLDTHAGAIVLRSASAAILCSIALVAAVASLHAAPARKGSSRPWLLVGSCCLLAAMVGGQMVTLAVLPAIVSSAAKLAHPRVRRGD